MKKLIFLMSFFCFTSVLFAQSDKVTVSNSNNQFSLKVNGQDLMINGMNWDYFPIGTNYNYSLWNQTDQTIQSALDAEMSLLKNMGVNCIRVYSGIPSKWIEYIYNNYGIYTMINHTFGRYGLSIDGAWIPTTDYANNKTRELLLNEVIKLASDYKNTKGLLIYMLGNENNYGLFWDGAETEDIPINNRKSTKRAISMYKLFNDASLAIKNVDTTHPVAMCNGDLLFLDIIAKECQDVDIFGTNVYRGVSFGDLFERVKKEYGKPVLFAEFGSDAFNEIAKEEDQSSQAYYLKGNWKEIYENAAGLGKSGNSIGGFTFQFSDGWWKYGQTSNLDVHDNNASWSNAGYPKDYLKGDNNMNEEWFGICAKGPTNGLGLYDLYPRAAYYMLKEVHQLNPYTNGNSLALINEHFNNVELMDATLKARGDKAALDSKKGDKIRLSRLSAEFTTFSTGGKLITTPNEPAANNTTYPNQLGFDKMESYYIGVEGNPTANMTANIEFNITGHVAENPIDQIFYENRARPVTVTSKNGDVSLQSENRVQVYKASYNWNEKYFNLTGFYRTGHYHWGYEGDFFNLYPEANYGPNMDTYNGVAPAGFEFEGKKELKGLKVAFGPQLWWGANPAVLLKYSKTVKQFNITTVFHEDIDKQASTVSSFAIPVPRTRRLTLQANRKFGKLGVDVGGIWGGQPLNGRDYQVQREDGVYQTQIATKDNFGGKLKVTYTGGKFNWYGQTAAMGLVANGGADNTKTFTGWTLKDSGSGNQYNVLTGGTYNLGNLQIAPNFLWQKPIEGPITSIDGAARLRNILDDPFVVRANREQMAGEILFTYDPTPGTWMYEWDNDRSEDAKFALSAGFVYRHLPTTQDAAIGLLGDGRTIFAFANSAPAKDLYEVNARIVSKINRDFGFIINAYGGLAQANGDSDRAINRYGADMRMMYKRVKLNTSLKLNDWGPYDYHRDFNLTFPLQVMADISTQIGKPDWFLLPSTSIGLRATYRTLDENSPRYITSTETTPTFEGLGNEWEIRTYVRINIGK
jgi:hypothetical protein